MESSPSILGIEGMFPRGSSKASTPAQTSPTYPFKTSPAPKTTGKDKQPSEKQRQQEKIPKTTKGSTTGVTRESITGLPLVGRRLLWHAGGMALPQTYSASKAASAVLLSLTR
ncbi:hypothetical protein THARTR1_04453 [Trichoderma harzianum]|uniref:Uncharacterized protein n=1 Tax=Trichoderma harzianum TaxID=5544 RepID=A0A2K0UC07_TRIHA|nr:hypothetical protein THARTR1_04453 [Trichoderma harzianum]